MSANPFVKATKTQLKARLALDGPTGAGKTWTALEWATVLADGGPIAMIDTERNSASLYADHFAFDTLDMAPPYEPSRAVTALRAAEENRYKVAVLDSLTHFWQGEGGTLDMVDAAAQRMGGNKYAGWSVGTPALRHLIDTMLAVDLHLIVTMRSKMDYVEVERNGRKGYERVGMAPVMRDGIEYEFTLLGDLDLEHRLVISKSRCDRLSDKVIQPGRAHDAAQIFKEWLEEGEQAVDRRGERRARFESLPQDAQYRILEWARVDRIDDAPIEIWPRLDDLIERAAVATADGSAGGGGDVPAPAAAGSTTEPEVEGVPAAPTSGEELPPGGAQPADGDGGPMPPLSPDADESECDLEDLAALMEQTGLNKSKVLAAARRLAKGQEIDAPKKFEDLTPGRLLDLLVDWLGDQDDDPPPNGNGSKASHPDGAEVADSAAERTADHEPTTPAASASEQVAAGEAGPKKGSQKGRYFAVHAKAAKAAGCSEKELRERLVSISTHGQSTSASGWQDNDRRWGDLADWAAALVEDDRLELVHRANGSWQLQHRPVARERPPRMRPRSAA